MAFCNANCVPSVLRHKYKVPASNRSARSLGRTSRCVRASAIAEPVAVKEPVEDKHLLDTCINAVRFLAIDAADQANSGHPGLPMGCAALGYVLYNEMMRFNPKNPFWVNRDRFILSAGHGALLQYALMHLCGYDLPGLEDLKRFRKFASKAPGHPENFVLPGVEVTTGPLGQGICNAVGLAVAEAHLAARFNRAGLPPLIEHYTWTLCSDGDMMEGMSTEASSLAGVWGLGRLIAFYDQNRISIDGDTDAWLRDDTKMRYESMGWHVQIVEDGTHDVAAIRAAIAEAKRVIDKPSLIIVRTIIGYGSPNKGGKASAHGSPLGADETALVREHFDWRHAPFEVPSEVYDAMRTPSVERGAEWEAEWEGVCKQYEEREPKTWAEFQQLLSPDSPAGWKDNLPTFSADDEPEATRKIAQKCLNAVAGVLPGLMGGAADLATSVSTTIKGFEMFSRDNYAGRTLQFGVREHGMAAICTGISLDKTGLMPFAATFFIFTDYMRHAMRLAAISHSPIVYILSHDSIGLGEDGPTHQPIEHLASFRAMPNINVIRPNGGMETLGAFVNAFERKDGPTMLITSRQKMRTCPGTSVEGVGRGAYVIKDAPDGATPDVILIGTGSELPLAYEAAERLEADGVNARVVSMPCWDIFEAQGDEYIESVLPAAVTKRVSVEAASRFGWKEWTTTSGVAIGIDRFGASAPGGELMKQFGFTVDNVYETAKKLLAK